VGLEVDLVEPVEAVLVASAQAQV